MRLEVLRSNAPIGYALLKIPELLDLYVDNLYETNILRATIRKRLVNFALVCVAWSHPALYALWSGRILVDVPGSLSKDLDLRLRGLSSLVEAGFQVP